MDSRNHFIYNTLNKHLLFAVNQPFMPPRVTKRFLRAAYIMLLVAICSGGLYLLSPKWQRHRNLVAQRSQREERNINQEKKLKELRRKRARFQEDPELVEQIARENRLIRPGEIVFIFDDP